MDNFYSNDKSGGNGYDSNTNKIYIGGIGETTDENSLRSNFEKFGDIVSCKLIDKDGRRFAFIEFGDSSSVSDAISEMHDKELDDTRISVQQAGSRKKPAYQSNYQSGSNQYGGDKGGDYNKGGSTSTCYSCK